MKNSHNLTYETIRNLRQVMAETEQDSHYPQVNLLWMAMTDWIDAVHDFDNFLEILHQEIINDLTKENIKAYKESFRFSFGFDGNTWRAETAADLEALFAYYPNIRTLDEILVVFSDEIKDKLPLLLKD